MVIKVFVSGTYDILHAGHVGFFKNARYFAENWEGRKQGEKVELIVSFASDRVLKKNKGRVSALPEFDKKVILESIKGVDKVYLSTNPSDSVLDFKDAFLKEKPNFLVVTSDELHGERKLELCKKVGAEFVKLEKKSISVSNMSTTKIRQRIIKDAISKSPKKSK